MSQESNLENRDELLGALRTVVEAALGGDIERLRDRVAELDTRLSAVVDEARQEMRAALEEVRDRLSESIRAVSGETEVAVGDLESRLGSRMDASQQEAAGELERVRDDLGKRIDSAREAADAAKREAETAKKEADDAERAHQQALAEVDSRRARTAEDLESKLEELAASLGQRLEEARGRIEEGLAADAERVREELKQVTATISATYQELQQHKTDTARFSMLFDNLSRAFSAGRPAARVDAGATEPAEPPAPEPELTPADREELESALDRAFSQGS